MQQISNGCACEMYMFLRNKQSYSYLVLFICFSNGLCHLHLSCRDGSGDSGKVMI